MLNVLCAWLGKQDLKASKTSWQGPIAHALSQRKYHQLILLSNQTRTQTERYLNWLNTQVKIDIRPFLFESFAQPNLRGPFRQSLGVIAKLNREPKEYNFSFVISGTDVLSSSIWVLISQCYQEASLICANSELDITEVEASPSIRDLLNMPGNPPAPSDSSKNKTASLNAPTLLSEYDCDDPMMKKPLDVALRAAPHDVGIAVVGEFGSGRSHMARTIHNSSSRHAGPCLPLDPRGKTDEQIRQELFGQTNVRRNAPPYKGILEEAQGGTVILEHLDELPLPIQIQLYRFISTKSFHRVDDPTSLPLDVRFISTLPNNIDVLLHQKKLYDSLFLRLAVAIVEIPPLRLRTIDFPRIVESLFNEISSTFTTTETTLTEGAINALKNHTWNGNIRELRAILVRAVLWSNRETLTELDITNAIKNGSTSLALAIPDTNDASIPILPNKIPPNFSLPKYLDSVSRHFLTVALHENFRQKAKVAKVLDLKSYQNVANWMKRLNVT